MQRTEYTPIGGTTRPPDDGTQRTEAIWRDMDYETWRDSRPDLVARLRREEAARRQGGNGGTPAQPAQPVASRPLRAAASRTSRLVEVTPGGYRPAAAPPPPQLTEAQAAERRRTVAAFHALRRSLGLPPLPANAGPNEDFNQWAERSGAHHVLIPAERFDGPPAAGPDETYGEWAAAARKWHVQP